jgi:hypothetical protein
MMLAAIETVAKADTVWRAQRHNSDVAAQATGGESVHAAFPPKSSGFRAGICLAAAIIWWAN